MRAANDAAPHATSTHVARASVDAIETDSVISMTLDDDLESEFSEFNDARDADADAAFLDSNARSLECDERLRSARAELEREKDAREAARVASLNDLAEASHFLLDAAASSAVNGARDLAKDAIMAVAHAAQLTNYAFVDSYDHMHASASPPRSPGG